MIIDGDYYNNPDNEGHIYFQLINLSPFDIQLKKGDKIGQGIIKRYEVTDDDYKYEKKERAGGFGSTSAAADAAMPTRRSLRVEAGLYEDAAQMTIDELFPNAIDAVNSVKDYQSAGMKDIAREVECIQDALSKQLDRQMIYNG